MNITEIELGLG